MNKQTVDGIYEGCHRVSAISALVLLASITGYYSLNEIGINKYNGLFRTLIPVALVELGVSVGVINLIDYKSMRVKEYPPRK